MPVDSTAPILVLQRSDVPVIAADREGLGARTLLAIDPGVLEDIVQAGLPRYELRRLSVPRELPATAFTKAMTLAARIDLALTAERERLFDTAREGLPLHGWDQGLVFYTLHRAHMQQVLGALAEREFAEPVLGLLRPDNPAFFHWDAMLHADLAAHDPARWQVLARYPHGRYWNPLILEALFDAEGIEAQLAAAARTAGAGAEIAFTHIPTCFYDARTFAAAIEARFAHSIDLPGAYCDVPVRRGPRPLLRGLRPGDLAEPAVVRYHERASAILFESLRDFIPRRATLDLQVAAMARRSALQAAAFVQMRGVLQRSLGGLQGHWVLSDHDIGFHGPLFSLAAAFDHPITVLPHSSYPAALMPHARRVTVIEREGVGVPVRSVLGHAVERRAVGFRAVPAKTDRSAFGRERAPRVCLLLNTMAGEGISHVEIFALMGFHRALAALCAAAGAALHVRPKPGAPALNVLGGALKVPPAALAAAIAQPLEACAAEADICIAFGEPTSATSAFLDAGSLLLHVSEQEWPADYLLTTPLKGPVMPSFRCEAALAELRRLLADPAHYVERLATQQAAYAARRAGAERSIFPAPVAPAAASEPVTPPLQPEPLPC